MSGEGGKNTKAADVVVNEIKSKNGIAVANYGMLLNFSDNEILFTHDFFVVEKILLKTLKK